MNYQEIIEIIRNVYLFFESINPNPEFLSNIVATEVVIIGIAIPLSFEIISKISERYKSDVISRKFLNSSNLNRLRVLLVLNIIFAISLIFIAKKPPCELWKFFAWLVFLLFICIILFFTFSFIPRVMHYMRNTNFILKELFEDAEKFIK
jgi:hypothetical protein